MTFLIVTVLVVLVVSATCSMTEAALFVVPWTFVERMRKQGGKSGKLLFELRSNIDKPISAVLTLNTVANTAGSAIAGALAADVFGAHSLAWFAFVLTLLILIFGEILPKTLGALYAAPLSLGVTRPLYFLMNVLSPVLWLTSALVHLITPAGKSGPEATEDDIHTVASLLRQSKRIETYEEKAIRNILCLDKRHVHDIMTPRIVVFSLPGTMTVGEAFKHPGIWQFSRIPVYGEDNEDIIGIVRRHQIAECITGGNTQTPLSELITPVRFVPESQTLDKLLLEFLKARQHLFVVLDEYGGLAGVVSLENVLEEMLGHEIMDESDTVPNMRDLARQRLMALTKNTGSSSSANP